MKALPGPESHLDTVCFSKLTSIKSESGVRAKHSLRECI